MRIDNNVQTSIYFDNFKLEEGDIATAWSMAPEDQMVYIDNINNYVQGLGESLENQLDGASGRDSSVYSPRSTSNTGLTSSL
mgnify:CR=1 FL=1